MAGLFRSLFSLLVCLGAALPAQASVRTISESGRPIYWPNPTNLTFYGNPLNSSGLTGPEVSTMLNGAFTTWMNANNRVNAQYSQSAGYASQSEYDGVNRVYFASHAGRNLDAHIVALTEVLYFVNSGQIAEADMVFNDNDFTFSKTPGDTGLSDGHGGTLIYLQDVATHEAGHAYGLDHSNVNLSSLFYTAFSGQYSLSEDDKNALAGVYGSGSAPTGSLTGVVRGTSGGIFGAQVSAINLSTGKVQAAALSNPDGSFRLGNLPDASYAIFMEPFLTSTSTVSSYFQNIDHHFCGVNKQNIFERGFYGPCGGTTVSVIQVSGGGSVDLKNLAPSCSVMSSKAPDAAYNPLSPPPAIPNVGSVQGVLGNSETHVYRVNNVNGTLTARALSYSLFSPNDVQVDFLDIGTGLAASGATSVDNVQDPAPGGGKNYDSMATVTGTGQDFIVRVRTKSSAIPGSKYPGGYELVDWNGYYLLSLSIDGNYGATAPVDMATCALVANTQQSAYYRASAPTTSTKGGGCGTLGGPGAGGDGPGGGLTLLFTSAGLLQAYFWAKRHPRLRLKLVRRRR